VIERIGVPYEIRTRVAAVKEKQPIVIQRNFCGMDSTLTRFQGLMGTVIGLLELLLDS
jgi:hypothetical protein